APGVRTPSAFGTNPTPTPTPTPRPVPGPTPQGNKLTGSGSGLYICNLKYLNTPTGFHFNGSATITKLGSVQVQVDLFGVGFKTVGQATGQMVLTGLNGILTLLLTGPVQTKLSTLPQQFQYKVVSATGAYAGTRASGTLQLIRTADAVPVRSGIRFV